MINNKYNEIEIYKAYLETKSMQGSFTIDLCKRLNVPRSVFYAIVKRVENGNEIQLQRCLDKSKYDCLWKFRYLQRFFLIDDLHTDQYPQQIRSLIKEMHKDGFGVREIGRRIGKDASTIKYHLDKK